MFNKIGSQSLEKVNPEDKDGKNEFLYACENDRYDIVRIIQLFLANIV